jgi:two-component system phosphate regulon sensor histidine kinase PhoR
MQLAVPAAIAGVTVGMFLTLVVLSSLHTDLATGLRRTGERESAVVFAALARSDDLEVLLPAGSAVLGFTKEGRVVSLLTPPQSYRHVAFIATPHDVPLPESFLTNAYVGSLQEGPFKLEGTQYRDLEQIAVLVPTQHAAHTYQEVRVRLILSALAGTAFLVLVVISTASVISRRVQHLSQAASALGSTDPLSDLLRPRSDELRVLENRLEGARATIIKNDAEIARLQKVRSEFLANVSHEVRTPLFSLKGFLETLLEGGIDDPNVNRAFLEKAQHHAQRLDFLLKDLIEISRIESGDMQMSLRSFALEPFLRQIIADHAETAQAKRLKLALESVQVDAIGDKDRLRQVFDNLLGNAVAYCSEEASIWIEVAVTTEDRVRITVRDSGPGIAPEHLSRIFERFYRVDSGRSRESGGSGLGLAIAKHIVEAHGSTLHVVSELGHGTSFSFELRR